MEDVGIFYGHFGLFYGRLVYIVAIWYMLWSFGIFSPLHQEKSGSPARESFGATCM
jgi:hypothetical protein